MTDPDRNPLGLPQSDIVADKRRLRADVMARREAIPEAVRRAGADNIAEVGVGLLIGTSKSGAVVSAYCAMGAEIDPAPLMARLATAGFTTCLPVLTPLGQPLLFRAWRDGDPMIERKWGIREPLPDAPLVEPDVLLVPLLAFDARCRRLGYGGGYYDRTLAKLRATKPVLAVGLAFDEQEVDAVPCETHDAPLDRVLTPGGMRVCHRP